ncbi:MAG TPA: hypothetical protein VFR89_02770, partial [candidate division Zixibacteria bacterium]|nr:hypothetical protein [candidate division Zixibacteria bacterium]
LSFSLHGEFENPNPPKLNQTFGLKDKSLPFAFWRKPIIYKQLTVWQALFGKFFVRIRESTGSAVFPRKKANGIAPALLNNQYFPDVSPLV